MIEFKGLRQVDGTASDFENNDLEDGYLYFVRTDKEKLSGYLYLNGKIYGRCLPPDLSDLVTYEDFSNVESKADAALPKGSLATINGQTLENGGDINIDLSLYKVVTVLPTTDIDNNKIYLVPNSISTDGKNVFDEYIYNEGWELLGQFKSEVDISGYIKLVDADKRYMKLSNSGTNISISNNGSMNSYGNNGQAYNAVRDCSGNSITGKDINAASFGVKLDGTTAFSHKTYNTFNPSTGANSGARNTAVLTFSGQSGLRYAKNTGSSNDVTEDMYKYVGVIDSPDAKQCVYSKAQVDTIISGLTAQIESLKSVIRELGGTID